MILMYLTGCFKKNVDHSLFPLCVLGSDWCCFQNLINLFPVSAPVSCFVINVWTLSHLLQVILKYRSMPTMAPSFCCFQAGSLKSLWSSLHLTGIISSTAPETAISDWSWKLLWFWLYCKPLQCTLCRLTLFTTTSFWNSLNPLESCCYSKLQRGLGFFSVKSEGSMV